MLDLEKVYPKMLAHCDEYLDSVGDHPLNLAATNLALNAYMLTREPKYREWALEYVDAWKERIEANGGNIPTNIGLDGAIGGEYGGKWYKGTYGWNFTIFDGEIERIAHRNNFAPGSWPGFGNAYLLTGDDGYIDTLRRQMDNLYAQKKVVDGQLMIPQMYGDPRGYKYSGREEWYRWTTNLFIDRLMEIYLWSMDRKRPRSPASNRLDRLPGGSRPGVSGEGPAKGLREPPRHHAGHRRGSDHARDPSGRLAPGPQSGPNRYVGQSDARRPSGRQDLDPAQLGFATSTRSSGVPACPGTWRPWSKS